MLTKEELLVKAEKPSEDAMKLHPYYRGKVQIALKCPVRGHDDFGIWYTPGVAAPCSAIHQDEELSYEYTNRGNTVAVVSDGTRVLGLGDIGPAAGLPVMEGKALLFKFLGGVDAIPICLDTRDPYRIMLAVKLIQPSFGGINLEDISQPKCFRVLDMLRSDPELKIPVWHDDQQGTATVILAGLINALKVVGKRREEVRVAVIGTGAANVATLRLLVTSGIRFDNCILSGRTLPNARSSSWTRGISADRATPRGDAAGRPRRCETPTSVSRPVSLVPARSGPSG